MLLLPRVFEDAVCLLLILTARVRAYLVWGLKIIFLFVLCVCIFFFFGILFILHPPVQANTILS
jgi:hypothetical protein